MLSSLSALIDRAFVIGFVVPITILIASISIIFDDLEIVKQLATAASAADGFQAVFIPLLFLWLCAILLEMINTSLYRFLEGYTWPMNRKSWKVARLKKFRKDSECIARIKVRLIENPKDPELIDAYIKSARSRAVMFPQAEGYILPTRFGNVIRSFEQYPKAMYGADGVAVWPLLLNVLPDDAKTQVSRSRAYVDMLVNLCLISFILGAFSLLWGGAHAVYGFSLCAMPENCALESLKNEAMNLLCGALFISASRLWYELAIKFAIKWGVAVKAAFDVNLIALAEKLPFPFPSIQDERNEFWTQITQQVLYSQKFTPHDMGEREADEVDPEHAVRRNSAGGLQDSP